MASARQVQWQVLTMAHIKTALDWAGLSSPPRLQRLEGGEDEVEMTAVRGDRARIRGTVVEKSVEPGLLVSLTQPRVRVEFPGLTGLKSWIHPRPSASL